MSRRNPPIVPTTEILGLFVTEDNLAYLGSGTHYQAHKIIPTSPVPIPHINTPQLPQYIKSHSKSMFYDIPLKQSMWTEKEREREVKEGGRAEKKGAPTPPSFHPTKSTTIPTFLPSS